MLGVFLSLIGIGIAVGAEKAKVHKASEEICKEKGWGDYRDPRSNEQLQRKYFDYYVEFKHSYKPRPITYENGNVIGNPYEIAFVRDPDLPWPSRQEIYKAIQEGRSNEVTGIVPTTRHDRYLMAIEDFEELGYVWDPRYNPRPV